MVLKIFKAGQIKTIFFLMVLYLAMIDSITIFIVQSSRFIQSNAVSAEETSFLITRSLYIIDMDGACRKCRVTFRKTTKGYDRRRAALVHPDLSGFYCQKCYKEEKGKDGKRVFLTLS